MSLANSKIRPTIPVSDMERAKKFYQEKLGLTMSSERPVVFDCADGTSLVFFTSSRAGNNPNTYAAFVTDSIEATMEELRKNGVTFEEYDTPQTKTVNGIATFGNVKAAWFKDSEGNTLGITQIL